MSTNNGAGPAASHMPDMLSVSPSEFLKRLIARDSATAEGAPPYWVIFKSGRAAFEERPDRWVGCVDETGFPFEGRHVFQVDAQMAQQHRAAFIDFMLERDPNERRKLEPWFRLNCPYALIRLKDGSWLPINREYEPLGLPRGTWADYQQFAREAYRLIDHPADIEGMCSAVSEDRDVVWLYNDDSDSRREYFQRFLELADHVALPSEKPPATPK